MGDRPRVALESTVIAHGLPRPTNLDVALECQHIVRDAGATPATIALVDGTPVVGLSDEQIRALATRDDIAKVSFHNLGAVVANRQWGATTVATTLHLASRENLRVFATGGIGGVHRGAEETFDISADLAALGRTPMIVVSAGAKSILDLPRTLEALETLGVPVLGYGTDEFPAFYARESGLAVTTRVDTADEVARIAAAHWALGVPTAVLVAVPCPQPAALPTVEISAIIDAALDAAAREGVSRSALTPFLLSRIARETHGRSLSANIALLKNNARVAAEIAVALSKRSATD